MIHSFQMNDTKIHNFLSMIWFNISDQWCNDAEFPSNNTMIQSFQPIKIRFKISDQWYNDSEFSINDIIISNQNDFRFTVSDQWYNESEFPNNDMILNFLSLIWFLINTSLALPVDGLNSEIPLLYNLHKIVTCEHNQHVCYWYVPSL